MACGAGHRFETWFRSSADCDDQLAAGLAECPECGCGSVSKAPMAPAVAKATPSGRPTRPGGPLGARMVVQALRARAEGARDVGASFARAAREMAEGETAFEHIRGTATRREVDELHRDGIGILPVPDVEPLN